MAEDTFPKLLLRNYKKYGTRKIAMRKKDFGIWNPYTWEDYYLKVKFFSFGLISLGLKRGDKAIIIGENDPEYYWAELAIQAAGGICVGIFTDASYKELEYYITHSDAVFVVAHDQEQVDKILEVKEKIPKVERVIYWDPKGLWNYQEPFLISFRDVLDIGREYERATAIDFEELVKKGGPEDIACFCYTSGTSALPKGAMLSYEFLLKAAEKWMMDDPVTESDEYLTHIPPAWIVEQILGVAGNLITGMKVNFPEERDTVQADLREVGPNLVFYAARLWENVISTVQSKMLDASFLKRKLYNFFLRTSDQVIDSELHKKKVNLFFKALARLGDFWVFRPLRDKLGFTNLRHAYTAGAFLSPDMSKFFFALGIKLQQIYGLTEITPLSKHSLHDVKHETVGKLCQGVELKITGEGEIVFRSPGCAFSGYYKDPEKTAETIRDGYVSTGDSGFLREDGHLIYYDRVKNMARLSDGNLYSPSYLEGRLKFSPYILDTMIIGADRKFVSALIVIDFGVLAKWAEKNRIGYTSFTDLSQHPEVYNLIQREIESINKTQPPASKVRRFFNLPKELDPDEGELTRTRKIRREFVEARYKNLIDAVYNGEEVVSLEIDIKYEDGRTGRLRSPVTIRDVEA